MPDSNHPGDSGDCPPPKMEENMRRRTFIKARPAIALLARPGLGLPMFRITGWDGYDFGRPALSGNQTD